MVFDTKTINSFRQICVGLFAFDSYITSHGLTHGFTILRGGDMVDGLPPASSLSGFVFIETTPGAVNIIMWCRVFQSKFWPSGLELRFEYLHPFGKTCIKTVGKVFIKRRAKTLLKTG